MDIDRYRQTQKDFNEFGVNKPSEGYAALSQMRARIMSRVATTPDGNISILDAGCREGHAMIALRQAYPAGRIVGVDIVPEFVAVAKDQGEAYEADIHRLPFADGEFDWVFCSHTLEHCYDLYAAMRELRRVTKGGLFLVLPLEDEKSCDDNPSHHTFTPNPLEWLNRLAHNEWRFHLAQAVPRTSDMIAVFLHEGGFDA